MAAGWLSLAFAVGCGDSDRTVVGTGGSTAQGGSGGTDGGSSGSGGSGGGNNGPEPTACLAATDTFAWPAPASVNVPEDPSWKASLELPWDEFLSFPQGDYLQEVTWVKFIVLASDPTQVYFHNAQTDPFHYEFATAHIPAFAGMSRAAFDAVTLENEGRQAILGAVLVPVSGVGEYGVQLVSNDDLHPQLVQDVMRAVADSVNAPEGVVLRPYYLPSGVSAECAPSKSADFAARGVLVGSVDQWLIGDACYADGWAVGKLVALPAADIDAAYLDGRLRPEDILVVTDTVPAELPYVAGIITLEPSTPNAHSAILARSYGVPFAYARDADALAALELLDGKRVVLSTSEALGRDPFDPYAGGCDLRFIDVDTLPEETLAELRALAAPAPIVVTPKRSSGALTLPADGLVPADIDRVGGKAAHFGLLRAAAPDDTPSPALAITFDAWDAFMAAPAPGGTGTLRDEIAARLAPHAWPADLRALDTTLEGIRDLIRDTDVPEDLAVSLIEALAPFNPETRIRFRSSTNVEDSESFTGAGLYDSATGCLADDLDADDLGPSLCNPEETDERGVLRALKRVYSSFYFRNAYFERTRRGVNEAQVGMGVLVHYSVPDPTELANGVATFTVDPFIGTEARLVTQLGAVSVTNPEGNALPEEIRINRSEFEGEITDSFSTIASSSLLPLGAHVLEYEADYSRLMTLFAAVADEYVTVTGKEAPYALDFEYKKVEPGVLSLRQVRPLPLASAGGSVAPYFLGAPETLCVYGSERADAFATHRLKARIALAGGNFALTPAQLAERLYSTLRVDYVAGTAASTIEGDPATFSGAEHAVEQNGDEATVQDTWAAAGATWTLRTRLRSTAASGESPVRTPDDFYYDLAATWSTPVPFLEFPIDGTALAPATRTEESVELWGYCPEAVEVNEAFPRIEASFSLPGGATIETAYYYPPPPKGATAGYTAPAMKWDRTTITGLTSEPIVLTGYFSQTYAPYHHNFGGQYIFDPRLEPGIPSSTLAELAAANIAYLVVIDTGIAEPVPVYEYWALGTDGALREL